MMTIFDGYNLALVEHTSTLMGLTNTMLPRTQEFLSTVGLIAGGINAFLLAGAAVYLIGVASGLLNPALTKDERETEFFDTVKSFAPLVLCLGLLTLFTSSKIIWLLTTNSQFSGAIGLLALAKILVIGI
jgi:hypothetical protein